PTAVLGHEVHGFGRRHLCRNDEIAFVLAVLVIDQHEHAAAFRLFDQLGGGGFELLETHCAAPGPVWGPSRPRRRATYRATWSISRLTGTPVPFEPRFVTSWVIGIILTPKSSSPTSFTVREMPSRAIEPLGAMKGISALGALTVRRMLPPSCRRSTIAPTPSTWPLTRWPPSSSPILRARSRLTRVPGFQLPSVVTDRVSPLTSKAS